MSDNPGDWSDWFSDLFGGEGSGGEGSGGEGGGGGAGGDFSDFFTNLIFNPITIGIGAIFLIGSMFTQTASQATRTGSYEPRGVPDLPDLPEFAPPGRLTPPSDGTYPQGPQVLPPVDCGSLIYIAKNSYGPGWETTIQGADRDACRFQITRELQREAVQAQQRPRAPAMPIEVAPELIDRSQPRYPPRAVERGTEGLVVLEFTVTASGNVRDVVVVYSQPRGVFDRAAIRAVEDWRYRPRLVNGSPVDSGRMRTEVRFELNE